MPQKAWFATVAALVGAATILPPEAAVGQSISDVRYDVVFNQETAARREIHVEMTFSVDDAEPVRLSLPAWTPGSYQLDDYAKNVRGFWATGGGGEIRWDKVDFDTWRVFPTGRGDVTIGFEVLADALDTGSSWAAPDFVFFNGTNVFLYPEGGDLGFESLVTFHTEPGWSVATGLSALSRSEFTANDYHELVDMPTFVGRFDIDSTTIDSRTYRLASYPAGVMAGEARSLLWDQIRLMMPTMIDVFDDTPWDRYTTMLVFDPGFGGGSALEHSNSHLGIYHPSFLGSPILASITAHEIFHAWNVKRLRPADLWPYDYGRAMPTELLWVSEGVTDYYADLAIVRSGVVDRDFFYETTAGKIDEVAAAVPVALEDASLTAWIEPRDGTASIYYPKGSLAGLMLDILIREGSENARSLDDVLRGLYRSAFEGGRGFTEEEFWAAASEAAGGRSFAEFHDSYVDGREPYPWTTILARAGLRLVTETDRLARIGISTTGDDEGVRVVDVVPDGAGFAAGVRSDDLLVSVGGIPVEDAGFGAAFRDAFGDLPEGTSYEIVVRRAGTVLTLEAELAFVEVSASRIEEAPGAGRAAVRVREGLLTGRTG